MASQIDITISRYIRREKPSTRFAKCSVSFEGNSFYSYRTEIVRRIIAPETGEVYYWFDPTRHSVTTGKHKNELHMKIRTLSLENATLIVGMDRPPASIEAIEMAREAQARFALLDGDTEQPSAGMISVPSTSRLEQLEKILLFMPAEFDPAIAQAVVDRWCRMLKLTPRPVVYLRDMPEQYAHRTDEAFDIWFPRDIPAPVKWLRLAHAIPDMVGMRGSMHYAKSDTHYSRVERMALDLNKNFTELVKMLAA